MLPDRGHLETEQPNHASANLDELDTLDCLRVINAEDARVAAAVEQALPRIAHFIDELTPRLQRGGRLIYLGAGTSGRLGVLDASECPPTFQTDPDMIVGVIAGGDPALRRSSEAREDDPRGSHLELQRLNLAEADTLLGIAAGGTTPYVLGALDFAAQRHALTALLTCTPATPAPPAARHHIAIATGPEVITGSTRMKAGTATKMVLNMISTTAMTRLGKVHGNLMVDLRATNDKLRDRAARIVSAACHVTREEALRQLDHADGSARLAIIMTSLDVSRDEAEQRLRDAHGRLRDALAPR